MSQKINKINLVTVPTMFLITLIYSVVMFIVNKGSKNIYIFLGQITLIGVWIFANIGLKKTLKNRTWAIIIAQIIFQLFLFAYILLYIFIAPAAQTKIITYTSVVSYVIISFIALLIMIYDLAKTVTDRKSFDESIDMEQKSYIKLNRICLAVISVLFAWMLLYSLIMVFFGIEYITLYNFIGQSLLIAVWLFANSFLSKRLIDKKSALIISQIIFQLLLWIYIICCIVFIMPISYYIETISWVYEYTCLAIISLSAFIVLRMQLILLRKNNERKVQM